MYKKVILTLILIILIKIFINIYKNKRIDLIFFDVGFILYLVFPILFLFLEKVADKTFEKYLYVYVDFIQSNFIRLLLLLLLFYFSYHINFRIKININFKDNISYKILCIVFYFFFILGIIVIIKNFKAIIYGYSIWGNFRSILASISIILTSPKIHTPVATIP